MSKELTELLKDDGPALVEQGTTLAQILNAAKDIGGQIWDAATPMAEHGAAEVVNALNTGNSYVPYGWSHANDGQEVQAPAPPDHGLPQQAMESQEMDGPER